MMELFYNFELPLSLDEFLEPIGKKDLITYNDFCFLFKSKKFMAIGHIYKSEANMFPVSISKFFKKNSK
jgi:hypothetical protein